MILDFNSDKEFRETALDERLHYLDMPMVLNMREVFSRMKILTVAYGEVFPNHKAISDFGGTTPFLSDEGMLIHYNKPNKYTMFYNEKKPFSRIRYTFAHEYGHIALYHLTTTSGEIPNSLYYRFEHEANTFAAEFLAPTVLLDHVYKCYGKLNSQIIQSEFGLSNESAKYRCDTFFRELGKVGDLIHSAQSQELLLTYGDAIAEHAEQGESSVGFILRKMTSAYGLY